MKALHLYCVIGDGEGPEAPLIGLDGRRVFAVRHRELAALVSLGPVRVYKAMRREEIMPHLFAHQAVVERAMEGRTVVPVKFGTVARDEAEVRRILERSHPRLRAALAAMEGKIELDVVAQWRDLESVFRQIAEEPEFRRLTASIAVRCPAPATEERIRIGQAVKARLDRVREERADEIVEALRPLAEELCPHALLDDRMILNTACLVERAREPGVGEALERLSDRYGDSVDFRCVGPLPPYSFGTVEVRTFELETIERARRLLDLAEDAGLAEIRDAYRRVARQCHPDHAGRQAGEDGRDAVDWFEAVTRAYRLLTEYRQVGPSFRARDVEEAVAVRLLPSGPGRGGA